MSSALAILRVAFGPYGFRRAALRPGKPACIGRCPPCDFFLPHAPSLHARHLEVTRDGSVAWVSTIEDAPPLTFEGRPVHQARLTQGSWFALERTVVELCQELSGADWPSPQEPSDALASMTLASLEAYAVIDAARDPRILELLRRSPDDVLSLFEGARGAAMADAAPYLVHLEPGGWLTRALLSEG